MSISSLISNPVILSELKALISPTFESSIVIQDSETNITGAFSILLVSGNISISKNSIVSATLTSSITGQGGGINSDDFVFNIQLSNNIGFVSNTLDINLVPPQTLNRSTTPICISGLFTVPIDGNYKLYFYGVNNGSNINGFATNTQLTYTITSNL